MNFIYTVSLVLLAITLGHDLGVRQEIKWVQNAPSTTVVHKHKVCYGWKGNYNTQVVACTKRGN